MDPNTTLIEMLELAQKMLKIGDIENVFELKMDREELAQFAECGVALAQRIVDLHMWLRRGGFKPNAWQPPLAPTPVDLMRDYLVELRNECIDSKNPGHMDPDGAVILSHAVRWLSFKAENRPYEPPTD